MIFLTTYPKEFINECKREKGIKVNSTVLSGQHGTISMGLKWVNRYLLWYLYKQSTQKYTQLLDIAVNEQLLQIDSQKFTINYLLYSESYYQFKNITLVHYTQQNLLSVVRIYKSAGWIEREVCEMFGIWITKHNDLRRLLLDYHFVGYPLRKTFNLYGDFDIDYSN